MLIKIFSNNKTAINLTNHEATCDISGLSSGQGYWLGENGYIDGRDRPAK